MKGRKSSFPKHRGVRLKHAFLAPLISLNPGTVSATPNCSARVVVSKLM